MLLAVVVWILDYLVITSEVAAATCVRAWSLLVCAPVSHFLNCHPHQNALLTHILSSTCSCILVRCLRGT